MLEGISLTAILVAILNVLIGGVLVQLVRTRPVLKQIGNEREANLLNERADEMERMRERLTALELKLEQAKEEAHEVQIHQAAQFEAERSIYRHRIGNLGQAFTALLMLLKKGVPVQEAVETVEKMRAEQLEREAAEAATMRAAGLKIEVVRPKA